MFIRKTLIVLTALVVPGCVSGGPKVIASSPDEITYQYGYDVHVAGKLATAFCADRGRETRLVSVTPPQIGVAKFACVKEASPARRVAAAAGASGTVPHLAGIWAKDEIRIKIEQQGNVVRGYWVDAPESCENDLWFVGVVSGDQIAGERHVCVFKKVPVVAFSGVLSPQDDSIVVGVLDRGRRELWKFLRVN